MFQFRDLVSDFFLEQVNPFPTRKNNILDLIFTNTPEAVTDVACISSTSMDIFSDHNLLFFEYNVSAKLSSCDTRTVLDYRSADLEGLFKTLTSINLSSLISSEEPDNNHNKPTHNSNNPNTNSSDIDNNWQRCCDCFMDAVYRHIPTKVVKKRKSLPWFDSEVMQASVEQKRNG